MFPCLLLVCSLLFVVAGQTDDHQDRVVIGVDQLES